jgi:hypothetical protein
MAIKKCIAVRLGVIFDSQATKRKQGGLPVRAPLPTILLLFAWEPSMTTSQPGYTKTPLQTGGSFYILIEKLHKTTYFDKNP